MAGGMGEREGGNGEEGESDEQGFHGFDLWVLDISSSRG
jgi:hypothetical protein